MSLFLFAKETLNDYIYQVKKIKEIMLNNKILPIIDNSKKLPTFYAAKNLTRNDIEEIIRLYEYILNPEIKNIRPVKEKTEQIEN